MKALVVGGGIGGLAAALAFHQRGWTVEVLERAPEITEIGAGLSIQPNGLRALDALGLGDRLRAGGPAGPPQGIRNSNGTWLIRNDTENSNNVSVRGRSFTEPHWSTSCARPCPRLHCDREPPCERCCPTAQSVTTVAPPRRTS
ncbi:FAD-dependent monooxygenase [Nocardia sp. NPDC052316]|uniref:FAD-dependent monooxygenase n=1 Tax=Nocardia sp. NPDC052316 TaxID=3364329 RepID=UPI0037CC8097